MNIYRDIKIYNLLYINKNITPMNFDNISYTLLLNIRYLAILLKLFQI